MTYYKQIPISKDYLFPVQLHVMEDNFAFTFRVVGENKDQVDAACIKLEDLIKTLRMFNPQNR